MSTMEQIARDMREGTFPAKSDATLFEEKLYGIALERLKVGAPGLGENIRIGIATAIARNASNDITEMMRALALKEGR